MATRLAMLVALVLITRRALIMPSGELLGLGPAHALRLQSADVAEPMPSDAGLSAIQEAIRKAGYGDALPLLPLLLLGAGGVLIYSGCAWLPEELSELPAYYYLRIRVVALTSPKMRIAKVITKANPLFST